MIKRFFSYVEIRTKIASLLPFLLGLVYAIYAYGTFNWSRSLLFFVSMTFFDMTTTALNNYLDTRASHTELPFTRSRAKAILAVLLGLSALTGLYLAWLTGLVVLAAGAACAGCCAQMIGFAVQSYPDNGLGGLFSQGLGTSMLQFGNIMKKPLIWLPPTIVSALAGAASAFLLKMPNNALGAGMGTSGLVGQFGALASMEGDYPLITQLGLIALMHFLFPALMVGAVSWLFRRKGWFRPGDMKLTLR